MKLDTFKWHRLIYLVIFFSWIIHLFHTIKYDKFRLQNDIIYFTDEGFWTYPARHKYLFGTWFDDKCHYNHRFFVTPLFSLVEYASIKTLGLNEFGIRLPSIIFYILIVIIFTFYIVYIRKKTFLLALFVLFPLFIERFFLSQFSMAVLESFLVLLVSLSFLSFEQYSKKEEDLFLYMSILFAILSFFVKSHGILLALPIVVLCKKSLKFKIGMLFLIFFIPISWNMYVRIFHPISYSAIKYDLFTVPRIANFTVFLLKDYVLNPYNILITPIYWFVLYLILVKLPARLIFSDFSFPFIVLAVFYFTIVLLMRNSLRYNLVSLPVYVSGVLLFYNKKFLLREKWWQILFLTLIMFLLVLYIHKYFLLDLKTKTWFLILILLTIYFIFYPIYRKLRLSFREIMYIIFLINGTVFIGISVWIKAKIFLVFTLIYMLLVNLLIILFNFEDQIEQFKEERRTIRSISFPLLILILYIITSPVYVESEIKYFKGNNRFREVINNCIERYKVKFDLAGGRAADNIMLFKKVKVIGVLGPDYEVGPSHRDRGYIQDGKCLRHKKVLIFGFPFKKKVSLQEDAYLDEFLHALPILPDTVEKIGTCKFIYDIDTLNTSALSYMNLYLVHF